MLGKMGILLERPSLIRDEASSKELAVGLEAKLEFLVEFGWNLVISGDRKCRGGGETGFFLVALSLDTRAVMGSGTFFDWVSGVFILSFSMISFIIL